MRRALAEPRREDLGCEFAAPGRGYAEARRIGATAFSPWFWSITATCLTRPPLAPQLLDRCQDGPPDQCALCVAASEQLIRPLGYPERRILAMLVNHELGGTVDVEVGNLVALGPSCKTGSKSNAAQLIL
jgi:hypothetical protein